jgi:hypothetical protein
MTFGAITLGAASSLNTNATTDVADLSIGAVTGAGFSLTLATGGVAGAEITGSSVSGVGTLTITNSGGTTFSGAVGATTVTLSNTTGTIAFNGALTATTLNTAAQAYNLALNASSGTITNAVTFSNTGTLALGASGGALAFTGGLTATAPSTSTLKGTISSTNAPMTLGAITLGADTSLNTNATTNAADLSIGAVTGATYNLTLATGGVAGAEITGTSVSGVGTLTITNSGGTTFSGAVGSSLSPITSLVLTATTGAIEFSDNLYATAITNSGGSFANIDIVPVGKINDTGLKAHLEAEINKWGPVIRKANIPD